MRSNHIFMFATFLFALFFREFIYELIFEQLRLSTTEVDGISVEEATSVIVFFRLLFVAVYLYTVIYLIRYLRGPIVIKLIPFVIMSHLLVNNPDLNFINSQYSMAQPYIFTIIAAGTMTGLFIYTERNYLYNTVTFSVHPIFDTFLDTMGILTLIVFPLLVQSGAFGYIPYIFFTEAPESSFITILLYLPLLIFVVLGIFVVVYEGRYQSFYVYRLIIFLGFGLLYFLPFNLGDFGSESLLLIQRTGIWLTTIIYALYLDQISSAPYKD